MLYPTANYLVTIPKYLFAFLLVVSAASLRIWPLHILETEQTWLTFYPAVTIAALYGGFLPGFFAALLSVIIINFGWPILTAKPFITSTTDYIVMLVYCINCTIIITIAGYMQKLANEKKAANLLLEKAYEQLQTLNDQLPGSIIYQASVETNGRFKTRYISNGFTDYVNTTLQEIINNPQLLIDCIHPDDRPLYDAARRHANVHMEPVHIDVRMKRLDGRTAWVQLVSIPKLQDDGTVLWHGLITDITPRKQLEQQLKEKEIFLRESGKLAKIGGWLLNAQTLQAYWAPEIYSMHEMEEHTKVNMQISVESYHPDYREHIRNLLRRAIDTGEGFTTEGKKLNASGRIFWVLVFCDPIIENGKVTALQGVIQDITERKELEIKLKQEQVNNQRLITEMVIYEHGKQINNIAYQLHENINRLLVATKMQLEYKNPVKNDLQANIDTAKSFLFEAIEKINQLFTTLNIPAFSELGFINTIEALVEKYKLNSHLHLRFYYNQPEKWDKLSIDIMLLLYAVLSERLAYLQHNHRAEKVDIQLATVQQCIKLTIEIETKPTAEFDDKTIFDIRILESRLAFYDGSLNLTYPQENITKLEITLPFVPNLKL